MKKLSAVNVLNGLMFLFLMVTAVNKSLANDYYWVGGTGTWSTLTHWASSSGGAASSGAVPTATDNAHFDANSFTAISQTVTVNVAATCNNMDWTGVAHVPTLAGGSALTIYGYLTLVTNTTSMKCTYSGAVTFASTSTETITMAGNSFISTVTFNGTGGVWTLGSAFTTTNTITLTAGTLTTNNYNINCTEFISTNGAVARTLNLGSSTVTVTNGTATLYCWQVSGSGLAINAGTSTIACSGTNNALSTATSGVYFGSGAIFTYYNVNFTGVSPTTLVQIGDGGSYNSSCTFNNVSFSANGYITNSNTFANLTFSPGYSYILKSGQTQTISGSLTANGTCSGFITIESNALGSQSTISQSSGSAAVSYAYVSDIKATGGATFNAANSLSIGSDNTGWTITNPTGHDYYWIGNSGNWSSTSHWATSSGGTASGCAPGAFDNVHFDNNSFTSASQTVTIDVGIASCNNMDWTGVTNSPTFTNANTLNIYGSLTFASGMTVNFTGTSTIAHNSTNANPGIAFCAATTGQTINMAGYSLTCTVTFNGAGGWGLASNLTNTSNFELVAGTLSTNNYNVNALLFQTGNNAGTSTLNLGSSTFTVSDDGVCWNPTGTTHFTLNAGTSTIVASGAGAATVGFLANGLTYYNVNFTGNITGSSYAELENNNNTFNNVSFSYNGYIQGSANTFNNLTFTPGYTYTLPSSVTQTINGNLNISGTSGSLVTIISATAGTAATFKKTSGTVCADYISLKDNTATGGAAFYAGTHSTIVSDVTGWTLPGSWVAPTALNGGDICTGGSVTLTQTGGSLGANAYWQWYTDPAYTVTAGGQISTATAALTVSPGTTTTYYLQEQWPVCFSPVQGPSAGIKITVNPVLTPAVSISITSGSQTMCAGSGVTFTAVPTNGGSAPDYNFQVNGISVQDGPSASYNSTALNNNDAVTCLLTSNATCASPTTANSNGIIMTVNPVLTPAVSISITSGSQTICAGSGVTFTTVPTNGGSAPDYNFRVNGISVQDGPSATYNSTALNNNDAVMCILTSNATCASPTTANSNSISMTVNPLLTPALSISITSGSQITCAGSGVTFTAVPTNGGSAPDYNFQVNGISVQDGSSATYNSTALNNNDAVTCLLTSNATCANPTTANSNSITMTVNPVLIPAVSISITTGSQTICAGSGVTFTAVPANGGGAPDYNFRVNGISVQDGPSDTYNSTALNNNDAVTCLLTSNATCASPTTANSNSITMTVNPVLTPAVNISITTGSQTICTGSGVTFTAVPANGGSAPDYNFRVNGISVQDGASATYNSMALNNNDAVTCLLTSNATCASPATANSNSITMTVNSCGPNIWLGTTPAWETITNWSAGVVPSCSDIKDSIPATSNDPVISSPAFAGTLDIEDGVTLTVNASLKVCGNLTGGSRATATFMGNTAVALTGSTLQTISGILAFHNQLTLDNTSGGGTQAQLAAGAEVDIYNALALQNNNTLDVSQGTLTLKSTSVTQAAIIDNFSGANSGTVTGNITAERYYGPATAFNDFQQHMLGSPVSGITAGTLGSTNATPAPYQAKTGGLHNCDELNGQPGTPYGKVFSFVEANASTCIQNGWMVDAASTPVAPGTGYSVVLGSGSNTLSLTGPPNLNVGYSVPTYNSNYPNTTSDQGRSYPSGINLLSNPYPATLSVSSLNSANTGSFSGQTVYVWNVTNGSYDMNPATIAPFQAFKVIQSAIGSGNYSIPGASRTTTSGTFQRTANPIELNMTITNSANGLTDNTIVGFNPNSTAQFDPAYDVIKLPGALTRHTLYTLNSNYWLAINMLKAVNETSTVLVGFEPGVSGTYTAHFDGTGSFDPTSYITLEDTKPGIMQDVRSGDYTFTSDATNDSWNRFVLHFTPPAIILTQDASCEQPGMINIEQPGSANWNYTVTDISNVIVARGMLNAGAPVTVSVNTGIYTLTLTDNNGYTVVKNVQIGGVQPVSSSFTASATTAQVQRNITFNGAADNAPVYDWDFGDGATADGPQATHSYQSDGIYTTKLTVTGVSGCISTTSQVITITSRSVTGIANLTGNKLNIWSYDNTVFVDFSKVDNVNAEVRLYNVLGQMLSDERLGKSTLYRKESTNMEAACIIVEVVNDDQITTKKVFIANVNK